MNARSLRPGVLALALAGCAGEGSVVFPALDDVPAALDAARDGAGDGRIGELAPVDALVNRDAGLEGSDVSAADAVGDLGGAPSRDVVSPPGDVAAPCPAGQVLCAGVCTLIRLDPRHCGACGQACAPAERCDEGVCRVICPAGQSTCVGADASPVCANLMTDRAHCGACGRACASGQLCAAGRCASICSTGEALCEGADASTCADLQRDDAHCGACGRACSATERCELGRCASRCTSREAACGGECVDLAISDAHCGACGRACSDGQTCVAGVCRPRCVAPAVLCGESCDDITRSARNCGACGISCSSGLSCVLGACTLVCPTGSAACGGRCVDLQSDRANCGACARACAAGVVCLRGVCTASCAGGLTSCDGACVNTASSTEHCGRCNAACATRAGASASCAAGRCAWTCQSNLGDCDGASSNGCETALTSTSNCGACGNACRVTGSGVARCAGGACGVLCNVGTADCDGNYANGCEVDTRSNPSHCGACNRRCGVGTTCVASACAASTQVIEGFDATSWPRSPWVVVTSSTPGTRSASCAQSGAAGLQDPAWIYRTDVRVGAAGERLSLWVRRGGTGRAYLGFGASASGGFSLVAGFNTSELLFQQNSSWGYSTRATAALSSTVGTWYRLEVTFGAGTSVTGRIYSASNVVLSTVSASLSGLTSGGVALRSFGSTCVDTLERR